MMKAETVLCVRNTLHKRQFTDEERVPLEMARMPETDKQYLSNKTKEKGKREREKKKLWERI